jgi:hypothetical protein
MTVLADRGNEIWQCFGRTRGPNEHPRIRLAGGQQSRRDGPPRVEWAPVPAAEVDFLSDPFAGLLAAGFLFAIELCEGDVSDARRGSLPERWGCQCSAKSAPFL